MAQSAFIQKTLRMKPEVKKIFEDLEAWHDQCRFNLLPFNPADLYRSRDYKEWARSTSGDRKPYFRKDRPQRSE
jgi:hypothetical protein